MKDLLNLLSAPLDMSGNYENRKVDKTLVNGLIVSTVWTTDMGYETALIDKNKVYPVERYADIEEAKKGHLKWVKDAETIEACIELGYGSLIDEKPVKLERGLTEL